MSKVTAKALGVITYLQEQYIHNTVDGPIYIPKEYITTLEDLLIAYQSQAVLIKTVKDHIEKLKDIVAKVPTTVDIIREISETIECQKCGEDNEAVIELDTSIEVPQLTSLCDDLERAVSDLDYYILAEELKAKKQQKY